MGVLSTPALQEKFDKLEKRLEVVEYFWLDHYNKSELCVLSHDERDRHDRLRQIFWRERCELLPKIIKTRALLKARTPRYALVRK